MATHALYDKGRESHLKGEISWSGDNIKVLLVHIGGGHYVVDLVNDQFLTAIASGDRFSATANLSSKTTAAGVADAADTLFATPTSGTTCGALVWYQDTGSAATSRLIAYVDDYAGLPILTSGADINLAFPNDANKVYKL